MLVALSRFALALGDGSWACPGVELTPSDVKIGADSVTANPERKAAQVHAMASHKVVAPAPARIDYCLPFALDFEPTPDVAAEQNPQTIECCVETYDGATHTKRTAGIQWVLNPWMPHTINVWRGQQWASALDDVSIVPARPYRFRVLLREPAQESCVALDQHGDGAWQTVGTWDSYGQRHHPEWGDEDGWWVTAETISASPSCEAGVGFSQTCRFGPQVEIEATYT